MDTTTAPVIPDEAIEAAAEAIGKRDHRLWSVMAETDRVQYRDFARAALTAALPQLVPATYDRTSAAQHMCSAVHPSFIGTCSVCKRGADGVWPCPNRPGRCRMSAEVWLVLGLIGVGSLLAGVVVGLLIRR